MRSGSGTPADQSSAEKLSSVRSSGLASPAAHLAAKQLTDPLQAHIRFRVRDTHGILCRIPVSQTGPAADFDEGGKAGKEHVNLALVQIPDVQGAVHILMRRGDLQDRELIVPEFPEFRKGPVSTGFIGTFASRALRFAQKSS